MSYVIIDTAKKSLVKALFSVQEWPIRMDKVIVPKRKIQRLINYHYDNLNLWGSVWQKWLVLPLFRFQQGYYLVKRKKKHQDWQPLITHTQWCSVPCAKYGTCIAWTSTLKDTTAMHNWLQAQRQLKPRAWFQHHGQGHCGQGQLQISAWRSLILLKTDNRLEECAYTVDPTLKSLFI